MKLVLFYHSLISDWNNGNAHFLRGITTELLRRGNEVAVYEPVDSWSFVNLISDRGVSAIRDFHAQFPLLSSIFYRVANLDLDLALADADVVIVHEWNDRQLVRRIAEHRRGNNHYRLLFHDSHHRAVTAPEQIPVADLEAFDGVLAYGKILRDLYIERGWARRAWTWHEAADVNLFYPRPRQELNGDIVWVGNWGDGERAAELREYLIEPVRALGLRAKIFGVRYPEEARNLLRETGIGYGGWLPNYRVPEIFARFKITVHIPRRAYVNQLPGIPTIRPFESLACGIPLVCSPWDDVEGLFEPGADFLIARNGAEMKKHLRALLEDKQMARDLTEHGLRTIQARHTCTHRVNELMALIHELRPGVAESVRELATVPNESTVLNGQIPEPAAA
jgi:spore maturation protein CgeB